MTQESGQNYYAQAEGWINPLLERGRKIETIQENVQTINGWVLRTRGKRKAGEPSITQHQRTVTRRNNGHEVVYLLEATDENDPDSVDALGFALALTVKIKPEHETEARTLHAGFRYELEDPEIGELEPDYILYCNIHAQDDIIGQTYNMESKRVDELLPEELETVYDMTSTIRAFVK